jgi:hypothetical protein
MAGNNSNASSRREINDNLGQLRLLLEAESSDSLKLLKDITNNPICSVTVDESVPCIFVVWKQYATSTQLRFIREYILELIKHDGATKVLGDDTRLPTIHAEDQKWIVEDWMPRAMAAGLRFCCSRSPDAYFGKVAVSNVQSIAPHGLVTRRFDVMEDATQWLRGVGVA